MKSESLFKPPVTEVLKSGKVALKPGESVGEHTTEKREEIIIVLKGIATIQEGEKSREVSEGNVYFIRENTVHNVINNTTELLEYVYVVGLFV